jgi:hypothetical protein
MFATTALNGRATVSHSHDGIRTWARAACAFLLSALVLSSGHAQQNGFTDAERQNVSAVVDRVQDACLAKPPLASIRAGSYGFDYDNERACGCVRTTVLKAITPELLRRDSAEDGKRLVNQAYAHCQGQEFLGAFARQCPALARKTLLFDEDYAKSGGPDAYCRCVVKKWSAVSEDRLGILARTTFDIITAMREKKIALTLDYVDVDRETAEACGMNRRQARNAGATSGPAKPSAAAPPAPTPAAIVDPRAAFEDQMLLLIGLAQKRFANQDSRLIKLVNLIMLPDLNEMPAMVRFAADRVRTDPPQKAAFLKIADDADALAKAIQADPDQGAQIVFIQKSRFALAKQGASAAGGNAQELDRLLALGDSASRFGLGPKAVALAYTYRSRADAADATQRNLDLQRAGAATRMGLFTLAESQQSLAEFQQDVAKVVITTLGTALLCDDRARKEEETWQRDNCRVVQSGQDQHSHMPIWRLDCEGKSFTPSACF